MMITLTCWENIEKMTNMMQEHHASNISMDFGFDTIEIIGTFLDQNGSQFMIKCKISPQVLRTDKSKWSACMTLPFKRNCFTNQSLFFDKQWTSLEKIAEFIEHTKKEGIAYEVIS